MDVDCYNFRPLLPSILTAISSSRFISFDLELSGIPTRQTNKVKGRHGDSGEKATLQHRYAEAKAAAERFHILQVGLTCVQEDTDAGTYTVRPYNFQLSQLIDKKLKTERDFTFSNGAVDFLLGHRFQMEVPFLTGIPYLSWEEEATARATAEADWDRDSFADISIQPGDTENLRLMRSVREEIATWRQESPKNRGALNIPRSANAQESNRGLNRYQKRLVHQLVRAEYPDLVSISRLDFIQILAYDKEREEAQTARKVKGLERNLIHQIGFRWIIEAICSKVEAVLPPGHVSPLAPGSAIQSLATFPPVQNEPTPEHTAAQIERLLHNDCALVGHNLFLDLIYLYACFFGPLPDHLEGFQSILASLFPMVIDTKYVADIMNDNSPHYNSALEELDEEWSKLPSPVIEIAPGFEKYAGNPRLHEAGYDSFLAARALIRLAANVDGRETRLEPGLPGVGLDGHTSPSKEVPEFASNGIDSNAPTLSSSSKCTQQYIDGNNMFQNLSLEEPEQGTVAKEARLMMPSVESVFWATYGNKLRVNGTVEEVCRI